MELAFFFPLSELSLKENRHFSERLKRPQKKRGNEKSELFFLSKSSYCEKSIFHGNNKFSLYSEEEGKQASET